MLQASNPAVEERGAVPERIDRKPRPARRATTRISKDTFLNHYFKRLSPEVAASFTPDQRDAIMIMFGAREVASHTIEVRRSIPLGRRRFYLVLLMGPERRHFVRLHSQGAVSRPFNIFLYLGAGALLLVPVLALLYGSGL